MLYDLGCMEQLYLFPVIFDVYVEDFVVWNVSTVYVNCCPAVTITEYKM
jgi:hypothetical protein